VYAVKGFAAFLIDPDLTFPDNTLKAGIREIPAQFFFQICQYFLPGFLL
jgi:hypothetical protein